MLEPLMQWLPTRPYAISDSPPPAPPSEGGRCKNSPLLRTPTVNSAPSSAGSAVVSISGAIRGTVSR
jgi:hypothetical protein